MESDDQASDIHDALHDFIENLLVDQDMPPLLVAACMMVQSLSMYRTILNADEYAMMTKHILGHSPYIKTKTSSIH